MVWTSISGTALYLAGNLLFKSYVVGRAALSYIIGLGLLAMLVSFSSHVSPLLISAATIVVMMLVTILELPGQASRHKAH